MQRVSSSWPTCGIRYFVYILVISGPPAKGVDYSLFVILAHLRYSLFCILSCYSGSCRGCRAAGPPAEILSCYFVVLFSYGYCLAMLC